MPEFLRWRRLPSTYSIGLSMLKGTLFQLCFHLPVFHHNHPEKAIFWKAVLV